jgi:RNA-directed DNA polymerase
MDDIRLTQQSFARKALAEPQHRFDDLYHLLYRRDWIVSALKSVLVNTGSRSAGVDGITKKDFENEVFRQEFIEELRKDIQAGAYKPQPVRRVWIPKANGKQRPLGILTMRDRVVQMMLKMLLEPIYESDFLPCSNGFRPGRSTMDCIATCYARITTMNKFLWVIEGDVRQCFDRINHKILLRLLRQRIADRRIIHLMDSFLKVGVMEGGLFQTTPEGTPQGGIISPLLANVYLHQFDLWWWKNYGSLHRYEKERRRNRMQGNSVLARYADDFILLCNGTRAEVERLREEVRQFLWDELHLELNMEKTQITHVTNGFDFLGFHIQWKLPKDNKPWLRVTPSQKSVQRLRHTVKGMTNRRSVNSTPEQKLKAVNRVLRGWINYYRHVSFKYTAGKLDWWTTDRFYRWLKKKYDVGARRIMKQYYIQETARGHNRKNLGFKDSQGRMLYLFQMADIPHSKYKPKIRSNPFLDSEPIPHADVETPFPEYWDGTMSIENQLWDEARKQALERDNYICVQCGGKENVEVHHIQARKDGGGHELDNLVTLCLACHSKTPNYRNRGKPG